MTRYVIIGAGAIGGGIGGRLTHAGIDAVLVARGDHLAALRTGGLHLRTPDEDLIIPVAAAAGPDELELTLDDVLVVATKTHQVAGALIAWADAPVSSDGVVIGRAGEHLPVLTAVNGVASEQLALRYFDRVYGVCVWMPAVHLIPGEVIVRGAPTSGMFHLARVPASAGPAAAADALLLQRIAADWTAANFLIRLPADVMPWKFRKLISNIGNAFQALVGVGDAVDHDVSRLAAAARGEARSVLDAAGIAYIGDEEEKASRAEAFDIRPVPGEPDELGGSTWQSMTRGTGNVETDFLNGEIAYIARLHGTTAPINATMASLSRLAAASGQMPGSVTADELAAKLGL